MSRDQNGREASVESGGKTSIESGRTGAPGTASSRAPLASRRRRWLAYGALAAGAGGLGTWSAWRRLAPHPAEHDAAALLFALNLPGVNGEPVTVSQWRGQPMVVNFWATWCAPCIEEMPELSALQQQFAPDRLQVVGIGIDSPENIERFSQARPVAYPLLVSGAGGSELSRRFGNDAGGLPYTVVIDRSGRVTQRIIGRFKLEHLREAIQAVVG